MNNLTNPSEIASRAMRERGFRVVDRGQARLRAPIQTRIDDALRSELAITSEPSLTVPTSPAPEFSRWRALGGAVFGASVPVSVFTVSHTTPVSTVLESWSSFALWSAVIGGLVFSAGTVYAYGCSVFVDRVSKAPKRWKAASFCLLAETIMTFAPSELLPLSVAMLAILVVSNAVETGRNAENRS